MKLVKHHKNKNKRDKEGTFQFNQCAHKFVKMLDTLSRKGYSRILVHV